MLKIYLKHLECILKFPMLKKNRNKFQFLREKVQRTKFAREEITRDNKWLKTYVSDEKMWY